MLIMRDMNSDQYQVSVSKDKDHSATWSIWEVPDVHMKHTENISKSSELSFPKSDDFIGLDQVKSSQVPYYQLCVLNYAKSSSTFK
jgi:hypothetical protein